MRRPSRPHAASTAAVRVVALALLAAACAGAPTTAPVSPSPAPGGSGWASAPGTTSVVPKIVSAELAVGKKRFLFILVDQADRVVSGPSVLAHVRFFDLAADAERPVSEADAHFFWAVPDERGLHRVPVAFTSAGTWGAEFLVSREAGAPSPDGSPDPLASPATVRVIFSVREHASTPAIGAPAPAADTPTLETAAGDPRRISTDPHPDRSFYELSLRDALAAGEPFLLFFGTPAFCQTGTCGPTLETIKVVVGDYPDLTVIHVEPYRLMERDGVLQPEFAGGRLQPVPAVLAWGLVTEPIAFLVAADGTVAAEFEGAIDPPELRDAIEALLAG